MQFVGVLPRIDRRSQVLAGYFCGVTMALFHHLPGKVGLSGCLLPDIWLIIGGHKKGLLLLHSCIICHLLKAVDIQTIY